MNASFKLASLAVPNKPQLNMFRNVTQGAQAFCILYDWSDVL